MSLPLYQAKAELFRWPGLQAAVLNIDDEKGELLRDPDGRPLPPAPPVRPVSRSSPV